VTTEITPAGGDDQTAALSAVHRDRYLRGELFDLSFGSQERSDNYRSGSPEERSFVWINLPAAPSHRTQVLGQYVYTGQDKALPGSTFSPTPDGSSSFWDSAWDLTGRHQIRPGFFLWLRAGGERSYTVNDDPDATGDSFARLPAATVYSRTRRQQWGLEGRLDRLWGGGHTSTYSVYTGKTSFDNRQLGYTRSTRNFGEMLEIAVRDRLTVHTFQHDYRPGRRLSVLLGVTAQEFTDRFSTVDPGEVTVRGQDTVETDWLPFGQATYALSRRDLVRFVGHQRRERGFNSLLEPAEAFLVDEFSSLEEGGETTTFELDYERYLSRRSFAKLFLFHSDLKNFVVAPAVTQAANPSLLEDPGGASFTPVSFIVPEARSRGIGARYEHQLGPFLSLFLRYTYREFTDETPCSAGDQQAGFCVAPGRQLPMQPRASAVLGLGYVDRAGTKLFAEAAWRGGMSQGLTRRGAWERLPSRLLVNLRVGRERSVYREWTFTVGNLFNTGTIYWPGFPAPGRTYRLQYSVRF
jgi:hypothetical protein